MVAFVEQHLGVQRKFHGCFLIVVALFQRSAQAHTQFGDGMIRITEALCNGRIWSISCCPQSRQLYSYTRVWVIREKTLRNMVEAMYSAAHGEKNGMLFNLLPLEANVISKSGFEWAIQRLTVGCLGIVGTPSSVA